MGKTKVKLSQQDRERQEAAGRVKMLKRLAVLFAPDNGSPRNTSRNRKAASSPVVPWSHYPVQCLKMQCSMWRIGISEDKAVLVRMLERHLEYVGFVCGAL